EIQLKIGSLPDFVFDDSNTVYKTVKNFDAAMATKWSGVVTQYNAAREAVLAAVIAQETNELPKPIAAAIADFDECLKKLDTERTTLIDSNPEVEKAAVQREIAVFEDRLLLAKVQKKAEAYINDSKWAAKARLNMKGLKPTKITNFAGELYNKHISDEYLAMFNEECRFLDAPTFVKISQRNTKGSTVRSLKIEGRSAIQILSEGEQRAIALADFLTEARMDPLNRGLFFDDPVSSQDHDRRENIAHRLVELAKGRQIIVFTHEISFLQRMKAIAEEQQVDYEITTVRKASGTPGIINPELPLPVMKVGKRIGWLRDRLVKLTKLEKNGEDDEYYLQAKAWYAVLRESWERAVEELVFKDVVQRYDPRVQTQRLNEVNVTDEMIGAIEKAMTASSSWVHDQPAALNPKVPTSKDAERDLASLA
ncbi:MAG: hypothetical protein QUS14_03820, partial [Pyrinomonadaceae bacterium]|nr:hypothetical protein [Pyrinomonadaceae bacterium]